MIAPDRCSLGGFLSLMWDAADLLADSVEIHCKDDKYMDIHAMVQAMTVQVVGTTAFGYVCFTLLCPWLPSTHACCMDRT